MNEILKAFYNAIAALKDSGFIEDSAYVLTEGNFQDVLDRASFKSVMYNFSPSMVSTTRVAYELNIVVVDAASDELGMIESSIQDCAIVVREITKALSKWLSNDEVEIESRIDRQNDSDYYFVGVGCTFKLLV